MWESGSFYWWAQWADVFWLSNTTGDKRPAYLHTYSTCNALWDTIFGSMELLTTVPAQAWLGFCIWIRPCVLRSQRRPISPRPCLWCKTVLFRSITGHCSGEERSCCCCGVLTARGCQSWLNASLITASSSTKLNSAGAWFNYRPRH